MAAIGAPWGRSYTLTDDEGNQVVIQGYDWGINVRTPESQSGWNLIHVEEALGEPDAFVFQGRTFRPAPA